VEPSAEIRIEIFLERHLSVFRLLDPYPSAASRFDRSKKRAGREWKHRKLRHQASSAEIGRLLHIP